MHAGTTTSTNHLILRKKVRFSWSADQVLHAGSNSKMRIWIESGYVKCFELRCLEQVRGWEDLRSHGIRGLTLLLFRLLNISLDLLLN